MLQAGSRLGRYEIQGPLGAGGMGQVYRARDRRLNRAVAIKVLPPEFAASPEWLGRFEREARAISQLSHPNICTLYDVGTEPVLSSADAPAGAGDVHFLVMELLAGETLADRLTKGPLPLVEALRCGAALAHGLDEAHRRGVIHRDLKPGNVMHTASGVKLLDFGLAREIVAVDAGDSVVTASIEDPLTREGTLIGTVPYMAPEQLEGRTADARTDIFALGIVLYEMIAGQRPFEGRSAAALMSSIMRADPAPLAIVRPGTPRHVDRLVRTCLAKSPDQRWQTAHDLALQLDAAADDLQSGASSHDAAPDALPKPVSAWPRRWVGLVAAAAIGAAAMWLATRAVDGTPPGGAAAPAGTTAFLLPPPKGLTFTPSVEAVPMAVSPDGRTIAVVAVGDAARQIFLRRLDDSTLTPLPGTDGARALFWSPDGTALAFVAGNKIKRLTLGQPTAVSLFDVPDAIGVAGSWGADGQIVYSTVEGHAIWKGSSSGGDPVVLVAPDAARKEVRVLWPRFLPDGRRFLYVLTREGGEPSSLMLHDPGAPPREVMRGADSFAEFVEPGYLVSGHDGALVARRIDLDSVRLQGEPVPIGRDVFSFRATAMAAFATSRTGLVIYQSARDASRMIWIDRQGQRADALPLGQYQTARFSLDGARVLFDRMDPRLGSWDLWEWDPVRSAERRLTLSPGTDTAGVFTPDGRSVVYAQTVGGPPSLARLDLTTGAIELLLPQDRFQRPEDVHPSGSPLLFAWRSARGPFHLYSLELTGKATPQPLWRSELRGSDARFSRDGTLVAYVAVEPGRPPQVQVASFATGRSVVVSSAGGGFAPRWHPNGRELFYLSDGVLNAVSITGGPEPVAGVSTRVLEFDAAAPWLDYAVAPDARRFLVIVPEVIARREPLSVTTIR